MTATERLRAMLDERGVEYTTQGEETFFIVDRTKYCSVWAINDRDLCASAAYITPEQAIAATLGAGTCHTVEDDSGLLHCSECGGGAEKQSWAYWNYCPNCGRKVER